MIVAISGKVNQNLGESGNWPSLSFRWIFMRGVSQTRPCGGGDNSALHSLRGTQRSDERNCSRRRNLARREWWANLVARHRHCFGCVTPWPLRSLSWCYLPPCLLSLVVGTMELSSSTCFSISSFDDWFATTIIERQDSQNHWICMEKG